MIDLLLELVDGFAGFDGGRTGERTHTACVGLLVFEEGIGIGEGFAFHNINFNPLTGISL